MKVSKVSNNNFGIKITDNIAFQTVGRFWTARFSRPECMNGLKMIRKCASDDFVLTFKDFMAGVPCEITIAKQPNFFKSFFVQFAKVNKIDKGKRTARQERQLTEILSPTHVAEIIAQNVEKLKENIAQGNPKIGRLSVVNNPTFKLLLQKWEQRATKQEIASALEQLRNCTNEPFDLVFNELLHENPVKIFLVNPKGEKTALYIGKNKKTIKKGEKSNISEETLSPMQVAQKISERIKTFVKKHPNFSKTE